MSADVNLRKFVIDALKPVLPKKWKWFDYSTNLDALTTTTVMLTLTQVTRFPEAPIHTRLVEYTLTVIEPSLNPEQREDSLDDSLIDVLNAIDDVENISWTTAVRGTAQDNLGYDITITIPINKTTEGA